MECLNSILMRPLGRLVKAHLKKPSEGGASEESLREDLKEVSEKLFGGASEGASRTAPQALQVALGNCVNPHLEHFAPYSMFQHLSLIELSGSR